MRAKGIQLLWVVVFVAFVGTAKAQGQAPPPNPNTHMGQRASQHVTLEVVSGFAGGCGPLYTSRSHEFVRNLPDGTAASGRFRVPSGKVLVITDVDWQYVHPDGAAGAGAAVTVRLFIENLANDFFSRRAFESTVTLSSLGEGGTSEAMTSGFIVSPAARICPDVIGAPAGPPSGLQHLLLRGYLAPDF